MRDFSKAGFESRCWNAQEAIAPFDLATFLVPYVRLGKVAQAHGKPAEVVAAALHEQQHRVRARRVPVGERNAAPVAEVFVAPIQLHMLVREGALEFDAMHTGDAMSLECNSMPKRANVRPHVLL
jgi:hypothetical protein